MVIWMVNNYYIDYIIAYNIYSGEMQIRLEVDFVFVIILFAGINLIILLKNIIKINIIKIKSIFCVSLGRIYF